MKEECISKKKKSMVVFHFSCKTTPHVLSEILKERKKKQKENKIKNENGNVKWRVIPLEFGKKKCMKKKKNAMFRRGCCIGAQNGAYSGIM